jgi:hypothetical protein
LLGFSMLFGLTGLIFSMTSYPGWLRVVLAPSTLLAQLVDISCWWLSRADPVYTHVLLLTGGLVAGSLFLQIAGSLFNLFGKAGKTVLLLLILSTATGGVLLKERVILPYLQNEKINPEARDAVNRELGRHPTAKQ